MNPKALREITLEQWKEVYPSLEGGTPRSCLAGLLQRKAGPHAVVVAGLRRAGKSTLLYQISKTYAPSEFYLFTFEDERLLRFQAGDFNVLYEVLLELFGPRKVFFFDEIQNVPHWESFVRRMQERGNKFFLSGSNASLLSRELGARLTGRSFIQELYPFSFREYLDFKKIAAPNFAKSTAASRAFIKKHFNAYLRRGGIPEYLKYGDSSLLKRLYEDILYRDIVTRHEIKAVSALRELALYFMSHPGSLFSYNRLKGALGLGSDNTVKSFTGFLEDSYLIFTLSQFSYSLKRQFMAPRKVYAVDTGLMEAVAFQFSKNEGKFLENLVFLELKRRGGEIFFYKSDNGLEVDFLLKRGRGVTGLIQVTSDFSNASTREREIKSLVRGLKDLNLNEGLILTMEEEDEIRQEGKKIRVRPVYSWLLEGGKG